MARRIRSFILIAFLVVISLYYLTPWPETPYTPTSFVPIPKDGKLHWQPHAEANPIKGALKSVPTNHKKIPTIQATKPVELPAEKQVREQRLEAVRHSFNHSWTGYKQNAWLRDEVAPISGDFKDTFGGWAATLVDSLDTLWIMGMKEDFEMAVRAVENIDFTTTEEEKVNVFETTIRYMGGFLAAYDLSDKKYPVLLKKAAEVGDMLMSIFDTPNRMPIARWDWKAYTKNYDLQQIAASSTLVSELGSLSLEFTHLSQLTGRAKYYDAIQRISDAFEAGQDTTKLPGMWPIIVDASIPSFSVGNSFTLGGMSDSLYEYLPKQYLLLGGALEQPRKMYEKFIKVAKEQLFYRPYNPQNLDILISGDVVASGNGDIRHKSDGQHLTCFVGGMVGIASKIFEVPEELEIAKKITNGCIWSYDITPTGIGPEIFTTMNCALYPNATAKKCEWDDEKWLQHVGDRPAEGETVTPRERAKNFAEKHRMPLGLTAIQDRKYILRPEAIESVFIMWRLTGEVEWQDKAWKMFEAIERYTKTDIASSAIDDVTLGGGSTDSISSTENPLGGPEPTKTNSMESFWLAETLKYFYLIFAEWDIVSLDEWVLNTEAHPLRRPS